MTDLYNEPQKIDIDITPYQHSEAGVESGLVLDPVAYLNSGEQRARERQVAYETLKLLRQRVIVCYRKEGADHYEKCRKEASDYRKVIVKKDMGQLHPNWANPEMNDGW